MKKLIIGICAIVVSHWCSVVFADETPHGNEVRGTVVKVADGDTITVLDEKKKSRKIRLAAIDAPEKGQPFSDVAKQRLSDLVENRPVVIKVDSKDRYGREVARVFVWVEVNELLVREGLAFHYRYYYPDDKAIAAAEAFARQKGAGVWALPDGGERPWDFRRNSKRRSR